MANILGNSAEAGYEPRLGGFQNTLARRFYHRTIVKK